MLHQRRCSKKIAHIFGQQCHPWTLWSANIDANEARSMTVIAIPESATSTASHRRNSKRIGLTHWHVQTAIDRKRQNWSWAQKQATRQSKCIANLYKALHHDAVCMTPNCMSWRRTALLSQRQHVSKAAAHIHTYRSWVVYSVHEGFIRAKVLGTWAAFDLLPHTGITSEQAARTHVHHRIYTLHANHVCSPALCEVL